MSIGAVLVAIISVAFFALVLIRSRIVTVARQISTTSATGVSAMLDAGLDDDAKERAVRQAGLQLLKLSWQIGWRIVMALAAVGVPIVLASLAGWVPQQNSLAVLMRVDFIVIVSVLAVGVSYVLRRHAPAAPERDKVNDASSYGGGDRLMHALAFSGPGVQKALAGLDDRLFARRIAQTPNTPPIFITSLARGGTTALLNALHDAPGIATHRYADMPFMSAPMLWSRLASKRDHIVERERSHGDGLKIGLHSPEAFDEIFWMLHWPEKYHDTHIDLWHGADFKEDAQGFLTRHFAKISQIRQPDNQMALRYLSKNNANIARLPLLPRLFPGCQIILPLREPSAHAASLHRQHKNFSQLHAQDAFSKRYMRDIGHLEFGALHRPMAFDRDALASHDPDQPDYWLAYWMTCFESIDAHMGELIVVSQDALRHAPEQTMETLIKRLDLPQDPSRQWGSYFRREPDAPRDEMFDPALLARARELYQHLSGFSIAGVPPPRLNQS